MIGDYNFDLEIVVTKEQDNTFTAHSPLFPDIIGAGKSDTTAVNDLTRKIMKSTQVRLKKVLHQISKNIKDYKKSNKNIKNKDIHKMYLSLRFEGSNESSDFQAPEFSSPITPEGIYPQMNEFSPFIQNIQKDWGPIFPLTSATPNTINSEDMDSVVVMGFPFSKN